MRIKGCLLSLIGSLLSVYTGDAGLLYYDGQTVDSSYSNTLYAAKGLQYTYANGKRSMLVSGGKRVAQGAGDAGGNDYFNLNPAPGSSWDQAGLFDSASGTIGGGSVEGVLYISVLVRAHDSSNGTTERQTGDLPHGRYFGLCTWHDSTETLGIGNELGAWAYSIFGTVTGKRDLYDGSGGSTTYLNVSRDVRLMVVRIAFHANAADDISAWLDPDPDRGDIQTNDVRRYIGTANGDLSFNRIAYRAGDIPTVDGVDFDEVRFGTDWASVTPSPSESFAVWYDGQNVSSGYANTSYSASGLTYAMANGKPLPVSGGKRTTPGTGDAGTDTFSLGAVAGSAWDKANLYDGVSGLIGGGDVSGVLYFGALVRAHNAVSAATEYKITTNPPPYGTEAFVLVTRPGLSSSGAVAMGNAWSPWAYSIGGAFASGSADLVQMTTNQNTYVSYDTKVHMLVAKITFKAGDTDSVTVWLDPNPDAGDAQAWDIRRSMQTGNFSFNQLAYRSGNLGELSSWDFDEVRFATDWRGVVTNLPPFPRGTLLKMH